MKNNFKDILKNLSALPRKNAPVAQKTGLSQDTIIFFLSAFKSCDKPNINKVAMSERILNLDLLITLTFNHHTLVVISFRDFDLICLFQA